MVLAVALAIGAGSQAAVKNLVVPKGTVVNLAFVSTFSSKTAHVGDKIKLQVAQDVTVGSTTVIRRNTPVTGVITSVEGRKHYGVNAKMRMVLNPVKSVYGKRIAIEPRSKGDYIGGKTGEAAGATIGGAAILGPVGLVGGYFVVGKSVFVKKGDLLGTLVSKNVTLSSGTRAKK